MRFNPSQTKVRAKKSSLVIQILCDSENALSFCVYNRRTHSIIQTYDISLLPHCRECMLDVTPIPKGKRK